jgi:hypothetical protein
MREKETERHTFFLKKKSPDKKIKINALLTGHRVEVTRCETHI